MQTLTIHTCRYLYVLVSGHVCMCVRKCVATFSRVYGDAGAVHLRTNSSRSHAWDWGYSFMLAYNSLIHSRFSSNFSSKYAFTASSSVRCILVGVSSGLYTRYTCVFRGGCIPLAVQCKRHIVEFGWGWGSNVNVLWRVA